MRAVFFDRQDTRHIGEADIFLIFQPVPQKVQVRPLGLFIVRILAKDAVPLVDDDDERTLRRRINRLHDHPQFVLPPIA